MRIAIVSTHVPFVYGGAEILARNLRRALECRGHEVALIEIPFKWYPPRALYDHALACRLMDLSESNGTRVDRLIGLKFPAWLVPHSNLALWIVHQHRQAYDLWDSGHSDLLGEEGGAAAKEMVRACDRAALANARCTYTIAGNVSGRLKRYSGVEAPPLYSPPDDADSYHAGAQGDYLFFPSRLCGNKRQGLVLEALKLCREPVHIRFAGAADRPDHAKELKDRVEELGLGDRITWLGRISNEVKISQYAGCLGVVYPPLDEDYGYVTLEAMLASKPVVTVTDAGGPLEFIRHDEEGLIVEPTARALAKAMDQLWADRAAAARMGEAARDRYASLPIGWDQIVERLTV